MRTYLMIFCFFHIFLFTHAQQALMNKGNMQVYAAASITSFGDFSNTSTAAFINNGTFTIKGNITNDQASMSAGTGTLLLSGTAAQSLNGAQVLKVYNLNTDNGSGILLNNDLSIANTHLFTSGIITSSSSPNYLIYENGSSYSGSSDAAHVNGWVRKTGATDFIYPVGNGTYQRPVSLNNLSATSVFNVSHSGATANTANLASPLVSVDPNEYWWINQVSGGTAQILMNWDNTKIPFPEYLLSDIRVANYSGGFWTNRGGSASGDVNTTGTITSPSVSSFGEYTFGSLSAMLPLNFLGITAKRKEAFSLVEWITTQEFEIDHFEVERKDDRHSGFFTIGTVAAGNQSNNRYELRDALPLDGTAYYRIRSVDKDGKIVFSKIVSLSDNGNEGGMTILNNPARRVIMLSLSNVPRGNYNYELADASGKSVQAGKIRVGDETAISIDISGKVTYGLYALKISNGLFTFSDKVIIQR